MSQNRFCSLITRACCTGLVLAQLVSLSVTKTHAAEEAPVFSSTAADLGIVASDLEKSAKFYKEVLGCTEVNGFDVPAAFATSLGLVDNHSLSVRVFTLGEGKVKTQLKLMSFPKANGKKADQTFIHSSMGFSYLTLHVTDLNAAIERLKKANVKLEGKTPVPLGGKNALVVCRDPDGNFIELIGPR
jgi:catechol 2,3-dioxygenase-like lactoylglutathione lyase family enzyme